ncbi:MAG: ABC transporter substrate-binding protein [Chloroflexota bacterium]|nr:ABC transporter substrate-binding protein [Chloroflexota bacterium]
MKLRLIIALVLAFMLFGSTISAQDQVVLNVLAMDQAGMTPEDMGEIADRFEAANPGVQVELQFVLYDGLYDTIVTSVSSNPPAFDIILVDDIWYAAFADAGWVLDVSDRITPEMRDGIFEAAWDITTVNEVVYGLPFLLDQKYFYYNTTLLAEAGFDAPPRTWEQVADMSRAIQANGVEYPMIWSWAQVEAVIPDFVTLLYGNGGRFLDEDNMPAFNDATGVATLQWMVDQVNEGLINPASITSAEEDVRNVFSAGNAAFAINWLYMYNLAQDPTESQVAGEIGISLMPVFESALEAGIESSTNNGSMGFAVTAGSQKQDAAWNFLSYLTSEEIQIEFSALQLPTWETAFDDPALLEANPVTVPMFAEQFPWSHVRPKVPYYPEASRILQLAIQEALTGARSPQEALDDAAAQIIEVAQDYQ